MFIDPKMERKPATSATVQQWTKEFPDLSFDGVNLVCKVCNIKLSDKLKGRVRRHVASKSHRTLRDGDKQRRFNIDLLKFMVGCNIPWKQLDNPIFREFIEKCTAGHYGEVQMQIPGCTTLRQDYLPQVADNIISNIRSELEGKCIWLSVDETTNAAESKITNILVGALEEQCATRGYLLASKSLDCASAESVSTLVNDSLQLLWRGNYDVNNDKFLLFITDGTAYMKVAGQILQDKYNCLHVTCLAHNLHRVAETVTECYPRVDRLISSVKKVLKAPERVRLFSELYPDLQLPPELILTRWGTWIEAATYYFINLEKVKEVLLQLDPSQAVVIANAQEAVMDPTVQNNLQEIFNSYSRIPEAIRQLEQRPQTDEFSITDQMNVIYDLRQQMSYLQVESAAQVLQKLHQVLETDPGFITLSCIDRLLRKQEVDFAAPGLHQESLYKYSLFRYAPATSVDMERSFSLYKWIFNDRRRRLTPAHMEHILLISWYYTTASSTERMK